jgi:4,5-DOPA dioxygenase extradiol
MRMPALFIGHGNPMNAIHDNEYSRAWRAIGGGVPRPASVLCVSAHWYLPGTHVTAMEAPRTIHDFGGFPKELFAVQYPAPGDPSLALHVRDLLSPTVAGLDHSSWGLDHGAWSVLCHVFPDADIPVVQLAIDETLAPSAHYDLARRLAPLRDEGVLVVGSGNVVHNLHAYAWGKKAVEPFDWAVRFDSLVRELLSTNSHQPLLDYETLGKDAILSAPTPEHFLPLLYVCALQSPDDEVTFPVEGFDGGSISMLSVRLG